MSKRLKRMLKHKNSEKIPASSFKTEGDRKMNSTLDWTQLPYDTVIQLFSLLNNRDRASLSSVCPLWRSLAASACLWRSLDLRLFDFDVAMANSLASRCSSLEKLYFQGVESAEVINNLNARNLIELTGNYCQSVTDVILTRIVDRHELLENIQLGPEFCTQLGSRGINSIARCCPNLKKLWISGVKKVNANALNALAWNCKLLVDLSFTDCEKLDEKALSKLVSVQFLSVAGVRQLDSDLVIEHWIKFSNLLALDVSRTDVSPAAVSKLLWYSPTLKVICALNCTAMEQHNFILRSDRGIELISILTYIPKLLESQDPMIMPWIEQVLSRSFLSLSEVRPDEMQYFWPNQGATLFINLLQSSQEDVQERTVRGIARFLKEGLEDQTLQSLSEAFINQGGVTRISNLGKSSNQGVLFELAKVMIILFLNHDHITNAAAKEGGIQVLMNLLESDNRIIVEVASETLLILDKDEHKSIIVECGGLKVLISLLYRRINENVLGNVIFILESMASDKKCGIEIIRNGGLKALVTLTQEWKLECLIASAFANLTGFREMKIIVEQEPGLLQALVQLIRSRRSEAAVALWNLSMNERNCESIVAANSIEALVFLANSTSSDTWKIWKSASEIEKLNNYDDVSKHFCNNIFGSCYDDEVHVPIIVAIWNLTFRPDFALRVVDAKGVQVLIRLSLVSGSQLARFLAVLVIANIFHVIPEGCKHKRIPSSNRPPKILMRQMKHIEEFIDKFLDNKIDNSGCSSSTINDLDQIQEYPRIEDVNQMECSGAEIARVVSMLNSSFSSIKSCAAFALMQFTAPRNQNIRHHISLLKDDETLTILRLTAESSTAPFAAVTFSKIVLWNLENYF